jgi:hypothetical protein
MSTPAPWWAKFAPPKKVYNIPVLPFSSASVAALILAQNHKIPFLPFFGWYYIPFKGVTIHKIDATTAGNIAATIITAADQTNVDVPAAKLTIPYIMACIAIESAFDPGCMNGNFLGSNPTRALRGYDVGIAQEKLLYLIGTNGLWTDADAQAFALDFRKAIPYMTKVMATKLEWADTQIASLSGQSGPIAQYRDRYYLATQAYNFGDTGMLKHLFADTTPPTHAEHVLHLEDAYSQALGVPSVFSF